MDAVLSVGERGNQGGAFARDGGARNRRIGAGGQVAVGSPSRRGRFGLARVGGAAEERGRGFPAFPHARVLWDADRGDVEPRGVGGRLRRRWPLRLLPHLGAAERAWRSRFTAERTRDQIAAISTGHGWRAGRKSGPPCFRPKSAPSGPRGPSTPR